jgi:hypothetical protein
MDRHAPKRLSHRMDIAFIVHSARSALLLDRDGVCRWYVMKEDDDGSLATARRCVGAQFVASLDHDEPGLLLHEPAVGTSALFAQNADGRISLVRFGPLVEVESLEGTGLEAQPVMEVADVPADADSNSWLPKYETSTAEGPRVDTGSQADAEDISTIIGWRSGFQIRAVPAVAYEPHEPDADATEQSDLATNQFARHTLDFDQQEPEPTSKRRGILPRRRTG